MGIGTAGGLAIGAGLGAAGSLGGAAIESNAAGNAAGVQSNAAKFAAMLQAEEAQQGLQLQAGQYNNSQQQIAPYLQGGTSALVNLENLLGVLPSSSANQSLYSPQPLQVPSINYPGTNTPINGTSMGSPSATPNMGGTQSIGNRSPGMPVPASSGGMGSPIASPVMGGTQSFAPAIGSPGIQPAGGAQPGLASAPKPGGSTQTLGSLVNPSLGATGSLMQPWTQQFQAPTAEQAAQYPGYQFQLQQGLSALQNSAAAQGGLLSGNTGEALTNYAEQAAQSDYGNVYNQALNQYQMGYNQFQQNQANQYNRLASLAGLGQVSAGQLSSSGLNTAGNMSNILLGAGGQIGQDFQNSAAATASGYVGGANAIAGGLGDATSNLGQLLSLYSLLGNQNSGDSMAGMK